MDLPDAFPETRPEVLHAPIRAQPLGPPGTAAPERPLAASLAEDGGAAMARVAGFGPVG